MTIDVLLRVLVGITLFAAAYLAEVVRGGLQAMPQGPGRGGRSRSASPTGRRSARSCCRRRCALVVPAIMNSFIAHLQGHLAGDDREPLRADRRAAARARRDANWRRSSSRATSSSPRSTSSFCFAMSRYSLWIERHLNTGTRRNRRRRGPHAATEPIISLRQGQQVVRRQFHVLRDIDLRGRAAASASSSAARRARASRR